jgi:hypothetical protein
MGGCGCGACGGGGMCDLRSCCLFCRGDGCGVCQSIGTGQFLGALASLAPYTDAGIGAQRWYDVSAEALFLAMNASVTQFPITSQGIGPGTIALNARDAYNSQLDAGVRLSASMICGVGGNIEATYMGVNDLGGSANVQSGAPNFYSFASNFGTFPPNGYDDTDRSLYQGVSSSSRFHSGEVNYRRRWVGPYSRFQGSWLVGVRHVDFSDRFEYQVRGQNNDALASNGLRRFDSVYKVGNAMTGAQLGGDLWWNVYPGINLGMGLKGAVLGNVAKTNARIQSNSIGLFEASAKSADTSLMAEFNTTLLYRFSYSWTFHTSYYAIGIEDVAYGANGLQNTNFANLGAAIPAPSLGPMSADDSLTLQGFSFGLEYLW